MPFVLALLQLLPYLPLLIQTVEKLHGPGNGKEKLASAVKLVQSVAPAVATAVGADAANKAHLENVINTVVSIMNATGVMKQPDVRAPDAG